MIKGINHITLAVNNIEKSFEFYKEILDLEAVVKWKVGAYLTAGDTWIALVCDSAVLRDERAGYSHIAFSCDKIDETVEKLVAAGAIIASEASNTAAGDRLAMLRDPWGVPIQLCKRANPLV